MAEPVKKIESKKQADKKNIPAPAKKQPIKKDQPPQKKPVLQEPINQTTTKKEQKNTKKSKKLSKKLKIAIIIVAFVIVLAVAATVGILYYQKISTKLEMPSIESITQRPTGTTIIASEVENASMYEFVLYKGNEQKTITSLKRSIELKFYLNQPGEYLVKVRVLGKVAKANSDYSQTTSFVFEKKLDTPQISQEGSVLFWQPVEYADSYRVYYDVDYSGNEPLVKYFEVPQSQNLLTFDLNKNLKQFGVGKYSVCVKAIGNNDEYVFDSNFSSVINYEYYTTLDDAVMCDYNQETKTISYSYFANSQMPYKLIMQIFYLKTQEDLPPESDTLEIVISDLVFENHIVEGKTINVYKINLTEIVNKNISKIKITAMGDNDYILPSNPIEARFI